MSQRKLMGGIVFLICLLLVVIPKIYLGSVKSPSAETYFINPSKNMEYFVFGYRELAADILWLRAIQDLDQCDRPLRENEACDFSWSYKMVDKVTDLSPQFRIVYATVPLLLSLSVYDNSGAIALLEKGLIHFPNDWRILYRGAYLYLFERNDKVKAADYFVRAQKNGAPHWTANLAARLYSEAGRGELANQLLEEYSRAGFPPKLLERMKRRLNEAQKTMQ